MIVIFSCFLYPISFKLIFLLILVFLFLCVAFLKCPVTLAAHFWAHFWKSSTSVFGRAVFMGILSTDRWRGGTSKS